MFRKCAQCDEASFCILPCLTQYSISWALCAHQDAMETHSPFDLQSRVKPHGMLSLAVPTPRPRAPPRCIGHRHRRIALLVLVLLRGGYRLTPSPSHPLHPPASVGSSLRAAEARFPPWKLVPHRGACQPGQCACTICAVREVCTIACSMLVACSMSDEHARAWPTPAACNTAVCVRAIRRYANTGSSLMTRRSSAVAAARCHAASRATPMIESSPVVAAWLCLSTRSSRPRTSRA